MHENPIKSLRWIFFAKIVTGIELSWFWRTYLIGEPYKVSMSVYFSNFQFFLLLVHQPLSWCWPTAYITVWCHLSMMTVGQWMQTLLVFAFCMLYWQIFWTRIVLEHTVNPSCLMRCCNWTPVHLLVLMTTLCFALIFNTTHNMWCWEYWYYLRWFNLPRVK